MNIASALLKQIIVQNDLDTWSNLKEHYLPGEFQPIFKILDKHIEQYQDLPQFEDLRYEVRDRKLQEKIFAIESIDVEVDAWLLLDYLKNEYAQVEILDQLDKYIDNTVAMATAEENIEQLQEIVLKVSEQVRSARGGFHQPRRGFQRGYRLAAGAGPVLGEWPVCLRAGSRGALFPNHRERCLGPLRRFVPKRGAPRSVPELYRGFPVRAEIL